MNQDSAATQWPFGVAGRPLLAADDADLALRWIKTCDDNHATCQSKTDNRKLPTRVVCVPDGEGEDPWLEYGRGRTGDYVALSYRWGSATLSKTLLSNESKFQSAIPYQGLSKTIRHAVLMTRKLGYRYLWVDSLCIIQDSDEDWKREAAQMAAVYQNAVITFSASAAESADSGLFYAAPAVYAVPLTARSIRGQALATFSLAVRSCSSFEDDVNSGMLSTRGWCLQERLLSRRILHFGASQTHWECLEGAWSASSGHKLKASTKLRADFQGELAPSIPRTGPAGLMSPGSKVVVMRRVEEGEAWEEFDAIDAPQPPLKQIYGHKPHGTWYHMLMDYASRSLTVPTDKLVALAGLATIFAQKTGDEYHNGLWLRSLPEGLLWSSVGLGRGVFGRKSLSRRPPTSRAPTWSWASLDGPILYPSGKYSYVAAVVHAYSMPDDASASESGCGCPEGYGVHVSNPDQRLVLKASMRRLCELHGFAPEHLRFLRENEDSRGAFLEPHAFFDDPERDADDLEGVFALFIAQVGCGNTNCDHFSNCRAGFAHCLLVERADKSIMGRHAPFKRVGVAQCLSGEFSSAVKMFVTLV